MSYPPVGETVKTLVRTTALCTRQGFIAWRWLLACPLFAVAALIGKDTVRFGFERTGIQRRVDMWDLFPGMLLDQFFLVWVLAFGFMLLVGDSYLREREHGAVALYALRLPSRTLYWLGRMGALGVMALSFVGLGLCVILLMGVFIAPPGAEPLFAREGLPGMYPWGGLFIPAYLLFLAGYTAWALWLIGCVVVLVSVFIPRRVTVPAVIFTWAGSSLPLLRVRYQGYARLLNLDYFVSFDKHDAPPAMSWQAYFIIGAAVAVLMAVAGAWRLRWEEL